LIVVKEENKDEEVTLTWGSTYVTFCGEGNLFRTDCTNQSLRPDK
jgi:hypothetical protein